MNISPMKLEFYERGKNMIAAVYSHAAPRQGEYVNIDGQQWRVAYVAWALDTGVIGKIWRANIEMEKVANDEVGPVGVQ